MTDIAEDDFTSAGDTVAAIVASAGGDRITDVDAGAVEGIAVIGVDDTNGTVGVRRRRRFRCFWCCVEHVGGAFGRYFIDPFRAQRGLRW